MRRKTNGNFTPLWRFGVLLAALSSTAAMPPISQQAREALDRALGTKGIYVDEESAYKFVFPRTDLSVQIGRQRLSPAQAPSSWVTFSPSMHQEGMMNGEIILLEDEVNRVMSAALGGGLQVTGLGAVSIFAQPRLLTMNVFGDGRFQDLAGALRKTLDEIGRAQAGRASSPFQGPALPPSANNIDPAPPNDVLSMRGVVTGGIYRAAIGRVVLVNGTPIGREMGMSTSIVVFGTNERAFARHLWTGGHSTQRLRTALTLVIAQPEQQRSRFAFHVINIGAGHSVPTGSNRRAVCLVADVLDRQERIVTTKEWMFAPSYGNRPDDRAFLDADQRRPDAIAAAQADAQGPHESTIRAAEERMLPWNPALNAGRYTVRARLIYDLNRYNDRRLTSDQTELHRATLSVGIGASAVR